MIQAVTIQGIELLGSLRPVLGAAFLAVLNANRIQRSTYDVIPNPRKVLHTPTANEDYGVLLQIVADTWNVCGDFNPVGQSHTRHFAQSRVRLFGRRGIDTHTHTAFLRTTVKRRTTRFILGFAATHANQLVKRGQDSISSKRHSYGPIPQAKSH